MFYSRLQVLERLFEAVLKKTIPSVKHHFIPKLMFQACRPFTLWEALKYLMSAEVESMQEWCVKVS